MRGWIKKPWASLAGKQYTASQIALAAQDDGGLLANQTPTCARARSETLSFGSVKVQPMLLARLRATINKPASTRARRVVCTPCLLCQEGQRIAVCLIEQCCVLLYLEGVPSEYFCIGASRVSEYFCIGASRVQKLHGPIRMELARFGPQLEQSA